MKKEGERAKGREKERFGGSLWFLLFLLTLNRQQWGALCWLILMTYRCFCRRCETDVIWEVLFERFLSVQILTISPWDLNPCPTHLSGFNGPVSERPPTKVLLSFILSMSYSMTQCGYRYQAHFCTRGILAWPTQITSNKPSPPVVPLHLCRGGGLGLLGRALYQSRRQKRKES